MLDYDILKIIPNFPIKPSSLLTCIPGISSKQQRANPLYHHTVAVQGCMYCNHTQAMIYVIYDHYK